MKTNSSHVCKKNMGALGTGEEGVARRPGLR